MVVLQHQRSQAQTRASYTQARIVDLEPYVVNGEVRFAAVLTPNTGNNSKAWWWYYGVSPSFIWKKLGEHNARLVDIEAYNYKGFTKYAVVMIRNTGKDNRYWWWYYNVTPSLVGQMIQQNRARLTDIEGMPFGSGRFSVIMERSPATWWWYYGQTEAQLRFKAALHKARLFHATTYGAGKWAGLMLTYN